MALTAFSGSMLEARANRALNSNPIAANNRITTHGSNWMWAVCAINGLLLLGMIAWTYSTAARRRAFHYFSIAILLVATIYYFVMASNLGATAVRVQFGQESIVGRTREVFWVRWVGYFINFTLIFFALLLLSGVGWATILFTMGLTMLWATMFLTGALVTSTYKWGFFVFAILIYFFLIYQVLVVARSYASRVDQGVHKIFSGLAAYIIFLMLLYPICWGVSEAGNQIANDSETVFYGILDLLSQAVFPLMLVFSTREIDYDRMGLEFTEYGRIQDHDHWNGHHHNREDSEKVRGGTGSAAAAIGEGSAPGTTTTTTTAGNVV